VTATLLLGVVAFAVTRRRSRVAMPGEAAPVEAAA